MPKTLCKSFRLVAETVNGDETLLCVGENLLRSYLCKVEKPVWAILLEMTENWGGTEETNLISFDFY